MNFKEMMDQLRVMLDDPDGDKVTKDRARLFLNNAYNKLWRKCIKFNKFFNTITVDITFSSQEMVIDDYSVLRKIQKIILAQDSSGTPIDIREKHESISSNDKSVYVIKTADENNYPVWKVGWYCTPTGSPVITFTCTTRCTQFDINPSDNDVINDIAEEHHDIVVLLAALLFIGKSEETVGIWGELYRDGLEDMLQTIGVKAEIGQGVVDVEE
jgi:hypothetical protein